MDDFDLENVLNEGAPAAPEAEAPAEAQVPVAPERDESGRFAPQGENEDAPPASDGKSKGLEAGIAAERKKRQEAEERYRTDVEALRREIEAMKVPQQAPEPPPSIWEDDQAALGHWQNQAVSTAVQQATFNARLDMSEMLARQANPDFDEFKAEFLAMAQANPALAQQALSDAHPWQRAYQIAKNARAASELGATNIEELKAQLLEQLKAEMGQQQPPAAPNIPRSLADAQSARASAQSAPGNPMSLQDILGG